MRVLVFSGQTSLQGWFGGEHSRSARVASRSTQECRTKRRPRWRRRRPWRPIYSASTGGVRYDLSLPPLFSVVPRERRKKKTLTPFFSSGRPQAGASPGRGHDGASPGAPLRESLNPKTSLQGRLTDVHCSLLDPSLSVVGGAGAEVGIPPAGRRAGPGALWGEPSSLSLSLSLDERKRN